MKRFTTHVLMVLMILMVSCDFEKPETNKYFNSNEATTKRVEINIEEAKALSEIAILNQTIISLSDIVIQNSSNYSLVTLSRKLKKDHLKIDKNINNLAEKKLILLPNRIEDLQATGWLGLNKHQFLQTYIAKVCRLLENQITQLEYLSNITNDVDFKVLTVKALVVLQYNLNKVQNIKMNINN